MTEDAKEQKVVKKSVMIGEPHLIWSKIDGATNAIKLKFKVKKSRPLLEDSDQGFDIQDGIFLLRKVYMRSWLRSSLWHTKVSSCNILI